MSQLIAKAADADSAGYPVVDKNGRMVGYLTPSDLRKLANGSVVSDMTVGELAAPARVIAYPDEPTRVAADRLAETDSESLPVVEPSTGKAVGLFTREDTFQARVIWFKEENVRERHLSLAAWLAGLKSSGNGSSKE